MKRSENIYRMPKQLEHLRAALMGECSTDATIKRGLEEIRYWLRPRMTAAKIIAFYNNAVPLGGPLDTRCLIWKEPRNREYGRYGKQQAHRVSYVLSHGFIPSWEKVCHLCHVPACINGAHLQAGTHQENDRQRAEAGRTRNQYIPAPLPILPVMEYREGEIVI